MDLSGFRFDEFQVPPRRWIAAWPTVGNSGCTSHDRRLRLQFFQDIDRCRIARFRLFDGGQAHLLEQDDTKLLR